MKTIVRWDHLSEFGIIPLTGESCGLGYRMLCDVTAKGKIIPEKCLGIPDLKLPPNWNTGSEAEPHVGSIMLAPELLVPIAVFALLENGCKEVWKVADQGVHGIQHSDPPDTAESLKKWLGTESLRRLAYRGTANSVVPSLYAIGQELPLTGLPTLGTTTGVHFSFRANCGSGIVPSPQISEALDVQR